MNKNFVILTDYILKLDALTSTDKIVLARRVGFGNKPYFEKVATMATVLNIGQKSVEKSIRKLKALGYWPGEGNPTRVGAKSIRVEEDSTGVGRMSTGVGDEPTGVGDKKSLSPLKTCVLLDNTLDNKLEKNKIAGLDCIPPTVLKKIEGENSISSESQKGRINKDTEGEASIQNRLGEPVPTVPLRPDGKPMTEYGMRMANLDAFRKRKPHPYTDAQILAAGLHRESAEEEFENIFENKTASGSSRPSAEEEFVNIFEKKTG
jgi:hypothetical protein